MRHHQRYFSVSKPDGSLAPEFVAVTNTNGDPDGLIRRGNERVLRARFNDARFFWQVDQQKKLVRPRCRPRQGHVPGEAWQLRRERPSASVHWRANWPMQLDADKSSSHGRRLLAKCDLTTEMVKEFTELAGRCRWPVCAKRKAKSEAVATAIYDQYKPVSMEDSIPRTLEGQMVALGGQARHLARVLPCGLIPTGSKDPFALRRAAQGVVKILFEARLSISSLPSSAKVIPELLQFLHGAHRILSARGAGFSLRRSECRTGGCRSASLPDVADRLEAIHDVRPTQDFEPLAASFKRIKNILKQAERGIRRPE